MLPFVNLFLWIVSKNNRFISLYFIIFHNFALRIIGLQQCIFKG